MNSGTFELASKGFAGRDYVFAYGQKQAVRAEEIKTSFFHGKEVYVPKKYDTSLGIANRLAPVDMEQSFDWSENIQSRKVNANASVGFWVGFGDFKRLNFKQTSLNTIEFPVNVEVEGCAEGHRYLKCHFERRHEAPGPYFFELLSVVSASVARFLSAFAKKNQVYPKFEIVSKESNVFRLHWLKSSLYGVYFSHNECMSLEKIPRFPVAISSYPHEGKVLSIGAGFDEITSIEAGTVVIPPHKQQPAYINTGAVGMCVVTILYDRVTKATVMTHNRFNRYDDDSAKNMLVRMVSMGSKVENIQLFLYGGEFEGLGHTVCPIDIALFFKGHGIPLIESALGNRTDERPAAIFDRKIGKLWLRPCRKITLCQRIRRCIGRCMSWGPGQLVSWIPGHRVRRHMRQCQIL